MVARSKTGVAVTSTVAVAPAAVAASPLSVSTAVVSSDPSGAPKAISTVAVTGVSAVPAAIGADDEPQVSTVPPPLRAQLHPPATGATANVSPAGRVALRVGSL